ncbi:MAG: hypothetical protein J5J06_17895 [Phycisphaerae bacterium]|nr:hypothetical protein [Phycisphaerae bacterium]
MTPEADARVRVGLPGGLLTGTLTVRNGSPVLIVDGIPGVRRPADYPMRLEGNHELIRRWNEAVGES